MVCRYKYVLVKFNIICSIFKMASVVLDTMGIAENESQYKTEDDEILAN